MLRVIARTLTQNKNGQHSVQNLREKFKRANNPRLQGHNFFIDAMRKPKSNSRIDIQTLRAEDTGTRTTRCTEPLTYEGSHYHRVVKAHRQNYGVNYSLFPPSINRTVQKLLKKTTSYTNYILYQKLDLRYTNSLLLYTPSTQISSNFGCPIQSIRHPKSSPREVATVNDSLCCCCSCSSCC